MSHNKPFKLPTRNKMGFMHSFLDPASEAFIAMAGKTRGQMVDIGAGYGYHTFAALKEGAFVQAIELDRNHTRYIEENCPPEFRLALKVQTGAFPDNVELAHDHYEGVLLSRVFIFMDGQQIMDSLKKVHTALKKGGRIFVLTGSPFGTRWLPVKNEYFLQKNSNQPWPGIIRDLWKKIPSARKNFPDTIHLLEYETLKAAITENGFNICEGGYYPLADTAEMGKFDNTYIIAEK